MNCNIEILNPALLVFRDDLYPFLGGGNKGRKIKYIEKDIIYKKANALVTTGGIQSNHNRATAILAAQNGWKCTLVVHGNEKEFFESNGNSLLMQLSGAEIDFTEPDKIAESMDLAMEKYRKQGDKPYYIYGGGHTMEGGLAYIDAVKELKVALEQVNETIDYVFIASGTGSTQAGILAGLDKEQMDVEVIGISVGREQQRAEAVVTEFYNELCAHYQIACTNRKVTVLDDYLCGGYGKYNDGILKTSLNSVKNFGFTLDRTYTAKAFYGMQDYIKKNNIQGKVLFWHTGGLLNFLAEN